MQKLQLQSELAQESGFTAAALEVDRARRRVLANEHFRYLSKEKWEAFNKALRAKTEKTTDYAVTYDRLDETEISKYSSMPPADVLEKVKAAKAMGIFDTFTVAKIKTVSERIYRDPIVFGHITGCTDRFYIGQWDNDLRIEDMLGENEG